MNSTKKSAPTLLLSAISAFALPVVHASELEISSTASQINFQWQSQAGMLYRLTSSQDLSTQNADWAVVVEDLDGTPPVGSYSLALPIADSMFYRLEEHAAGPEPLVEIEMVTVGNVGNAADPGGRTTISGNRGGVDYEYQIGKYEVTNQQYAIFLNAVDPTGENPRELFQTQMSSDTVNGGISFQVQNFDGAKYSAKPGFESRPVSYPNAYDAMRFCNWLHNGAQVGGDTENGAYTLEGEGASPTNRDTVQRNADARFTLPTENEWYKAAYHHPFADGGDVDDYWDFPTGSNDDPISATPPSLATAANYGDILNQVTNVGAYTNTVGFYGTFDMGGNLDEWTETRNFQALLTRRGGSFTSFASRLKSNSLTSTSGGLHFGVTTFRISGQ